MDQGFMKKVLFIVMKYGHCLKEELKELFLMFNLIKFKIINTYGVRSNFLYDTNKFYEVQCEPSYYGDIILLCNKKTITAAITSKKTAINKIALVLLLIIPIITLL